MRDSRSNGNVKGEPQSSSGAGTSITGTGSMSIPIYTSPGRAGFGAKLALSYDAGAGNGPAAEPAVVDARSAQVAVDDTSDGATAKAILGALRLLDARLSIAAEAIKLLFGPEISRDLFRGLHIRPTDVDLSLGRAPVEPLLGPLGFGCPLLAPAVVRGTPFERLRDVFALSSFDLDVILMTLAPEIDGRYERLYAFIQDDVNRRRPTVDVALNLLCSNVEEKLARLGRFSSDAPLVRNGLVVLHGPEGPEAPPRLSTSIKLDETVLGFLLGHAWLDSRIARYSKLFPASSAPSRGEIRGQGVAIYAQGRDFEEVLAQVRRHAGDRSILAFDAEQALWAGADWDSALAIAFRTVALGGHSLLVHRADLLLDVEQRPRLGQLLRRVAAHREDVYLGGSARWESGGSQTAAVITLGQTPPVPKAIVTLWEQELDRQQAAVSLPVLTRLAATFASLTAGQIAAAVAHAVHACGRSVVGHLTAEHLFEGARRQTRSALGGLAERVQIEPAWDDLILPAETCAQLREIPLRVVHRSTVLDDWGFAGKRAYGRGTAVLFSGSSGTGKTFAAAVLASELGQDLFRIDLSAVVSKYIGETEKNLARLFDATERANCVLLFDEADALFGKRSEVKSAHDRYANQEVAYLLQRIEQFSGLAILTTNMPGAIDQAFSRRLAMTVYFPIPDAAARRRLWERAWSPDAPRAADVDLGLLANRFPVSGGVITKAALASAYLAAETGPPISMKHVLHALRREVSGMGISIPELGAASP